MYGYLYIPFYRVLPQHVTQDKLFSSSILFVFFISINQSIMYVLNFYHSILGYGQLALDVSLTLLDSWSVWVEIANLRNCTGPITCSYCVQWNKDWLIDCKVPAHSGDLNRTFLKIHLIFNSQHRTPAKWLDLVWTWFQKILGCHICKTCESSNITPNNTKLLVTANWSDYM